VLWGHDLDVPLAYSLVQGITLGCDAVAVYLPSSRGGTNGDNGISVDSFGIEDRANELSNSTQAHRRGSIVIREVERWKFIHEAQAYAFRSSSQKDQPGAESKVGKENIWERPSSPSKAEANNVNCSSQEDCGVSAGEVGEVGEGEGSAEEGGVGVSHHVGKM
jgi:hypothetical protein